MPLPTPVNTSAPSEPASVEEARHFIESMAHALATYGTPAHRLEEALVTIADKLGLEGDFFSAPTSVFVSLRQPGRRGATTLIRIHPGEVDLEMLVRLDEILVDVAEGAIDVTEGTERVRRALASDVRYGPAITLASFAGSSACAARFFGGGVAEILAALAFGAAIGLIIMLASRGRDLARLIDFLCGLLVSFGSIAWAALITPVTPEVLVFAGLIVLFPGLTLTMAINELASRHLSSGTARLMSALTVLVSIGFGVALGTRLAEFAFPETLGAIQPITPLPEWTLYLAVALAPVALSVLFKAHPKDTPALVASGMIAFLGARLGMLTLGPELGACIGAGLMGLFANLYSRVARRPSAVPSTVGVMLLVPGSLSFQSVSSFLEHDALSGVETAFTTVLVAMSLVVGFLLANVALPPRRAL